MTASEAVAGISDGLVFVSVLGVVMYSVAWVSAGLIRGGAAEHRATIWRVALLSIVVVPFLRAWNVEEREREPLPIAFEGSAPKGAERLVELRIEERRSGLIEDEEIIAVSLSKNAAGSIPDRPSKSGLGEAPGREEALGGEAETEALLIPAAWRNTVVAVWAVGAIAAWIRLLLGVRSLARVRGRSAPCPPTMRGRFRACRKWLGIKRAVDLRVGEGVSSPVLIGGRRATVILPDELAVALNEQELDAVYLHELAHAARGDDWSRFAERAVIASLWFHPAVHLVARRLDEEREMACDDMAAVALGSRRSFAQSLVRACEVALSSRARTLEIAPAAFRGRGTGGRGIGDRVRRLVRRQSPPCPVFLRCASIALVAGVAAAALTAPALTSERVTYVAIPYTQKCVLDEAWASGDYEVRFSAQYDIRADSGAPFGRLLFEEVTLGARTRLEAVARESGPVEWIVTVDGRQLTDRQQAESVGRAAVERAALELEEAAVSDLRRSLRHFGWE